METFNITIILAVFTLFFSIIAYFLKSLHGDFKRVEQDIAEVKTTTKLIRAEQRSVHGLLNQRSDFLEQRLEQLERSPKARDRGGRVKAAS